MFNIHTGRDLDSQNQFQDLRQTIRRKADNLCRGQGAQAVTRRKDMINILVEATKILKAMTTVEEVKAKKAK